MSGFRENSQSKATSVEEQNVQNNINESMNEENAQPSQNEFTHISQENVQPFLNESTSENGQTVAQIPYNTDQTDSAINDIGEQRAILAAEYDGLDNSQRLEKAKQLLGETAVIGEIVKPYAPLITSLNEAIRRIYNTYEYAQFNKQISNALLDRVDCIAAPIKALKRRKDKIETNFLSQTYYNSLMKILAIVKKAQHFITDISYLWSLRKFQTTNTIKERFERIAREFDKVISEVPLEIALDNELQIPGEDWISSNNVPPRELINNVNPGINTQRGNVRKRYWLNSGEKIPVACKRFDTPQSQKFQDQLIVMNKLNNCPYLLKFHGLSALEWEPLESIVMVFEWAEKNNLKRLYEKYSISWQTKLNIVVGICRGLLFLHGSDILHYDLRCENIFPKVANFRLCRPLHDEKIYIRHDDPAEHWAAPEHLKNELRISYYTAKCDIFSFGMLLWELCFDRIPYRGWNNGKISNHVQAGKRENLNFGPNSTRVQQDFSKIIRAAWQDDATLRPGLYKIFLQLDELYSQFTQRENENEKIQPRKFDDDDTVILILPEQEKAYNNEYQTKMNNTNLNIIPVVKPLLRFTEGLTSHEKGDHKTAWDCFNKHASIGNSRAKYWKAYYLQNGMHVQKNHHEAVELYKQAADAGVPEAQYCYARSLIENDTLKNSEEFIRYLTLAAHNNNTNALFTLGSVYVKGTYGITVDEEKGRHFLRLASLQDDQRALDLLKNFGEKHFPY
ncbi:4798_t:CDS:2 [Funneliformis geosporum]|nr:4798_t:CDS:2 [Funneliformis geosporum]